MPDSSCVTCSIEFDPCDAELPSPDSDSVNVTNNHSCLRGISVLIRGGIFSSEYGMRSLKTSLMRNIVAYMLVKSGQVKSEIE